MKKPRELLKILFVLVHDRTYDELDSVPKNGPEINIQT